MSHIDMDWHNPKRTKNFEVNQPRKAWIIEQIHASCSRHRVRLTEISSEFSSGAPDSASGIREPAKR